MNTIVYVVMSNDFPDSVWATEELAEQYCAKRRAENQQIYWKVYDFHVRNNAND